MMIFLHKWIPWGCQASHLHVRLITYPLRGFSYIYFLLFKNVVGLMCYLYCHVDGVRLSNRNAYVANQSLMESHEHKAHMVTSMEGECIIMWSSTHESVSFPDLGSRMCNRCPSCNANNFWHTFSQIENMLIALLTIVHLLHCNI